MGWYIESTQNGPLPAKGKVTALIQAGAVPIDQPFNGGPDIICVINNGPYEAAAVMVDNQELKRFIHPQDSRTEAG